MSADFCVKAPLAKRPTSSVRLHELSVGAHSRITMSSIGSRW